MNLEELPELYAEIERAVAALNENHPLKKDNFKVGRSI